MFPTLLLIAAAASACPEPSFEFTGQPDCVELSFQDGRTRVTNSCPHPLLVDESVQLQTRAAAPNSLIQAQSSTEIRDLAAFTVGMNGKLYSVVAALTTPPACEDAD